MDKCVLIKPDISYEKDILAFRQEMLDANSSMDGTGSLKTMDNVSDWLEFHKRCENEETLPEGLVTCEQFIYVRESDNKILGMIQFRHYFNDYLKECGGHIGYSIRPYERRKGYSKGMLADCLRICKSHGLHKVLITCIQGNEASKATILANGGVYESTVYNVVENKYYERYWITIYT